MARHQFSLKTMLWLVTLAAVGVAGFAAGQQYEHRKLKESVDAHTLAADRLKQVMEQDRCALEEITRVLELTKRRRRGAHEE